MRVPLLIGLLVAFPRLAAAQDPLVPYDPAFSVDRLAPAPGPGVFLQVEDGDVAERGEPAAHALISFSTRPLVVRSATTGEELTVPVSTRTGLDLGAAIGIGGDAQVGLSLPLVLYQSGDRLAGLDLPDGERGLGAVALGDLRLHGKLSLVRPEGGLGQAFAVAFVVSLPTGDDAEFAGEAGVVVEMRLIGSYRRPRWAVALNLGPRFRGEEVPFLSPERTLGNELCLGAAATASLASLPWLWGLVELAGARGDHGVSPAEARLGARVELGPGLAVGAYAGFGLNDAIGAPAARAVVAVTVVPRPRIDSDGDGVPDGVDRCRREPEDPDGHEDGDGCPDRDDDGDGIPDDADRCADTPEDLDDFLDDDGCPDADNDGDRVLDDVDVCPDDPYDRCQTS